MNGFFVIPLSKEDKTHALVISSCGDKAVRWEHVSARVCVEKYHGKLKERCPTWGEMCLLKDIFFKEDEVVVQYHPKKEDYVNIHPNVLHLWRPLDADIPTPPKAAV